MAGGVEMAVETARAVPALDGGPLEIRMLGPLTVRRQGITLELPQSRKVRALLAYLALTPRAVARSQLCELLWDVPNDPRGELRWCLSKIRALVDEPERRRVACEADTVRLDLADVFVDVVEIVRAAQDGIEAIASTRLRALAAMFAGDFLEGLGTLRSPVFNGWLTARRRRFRDHHAGIMERLVISAPDEEALGHLDKCLELAPFALHVHQLLLDRLARRGRFRDGEEHLATTTRLFEAEGVDAAPLRAAWRSARAQRDQPRGVPSVTAATEDRRDGSNAVLPRRASLAVMPFADRNPAAHPRGGAADALASDVITRLAKLRSLFVIGHGTVFTLQQRGVGPEEAGRMLGVDYVASGSVRQEGKRLRVTVELTEVQTARLVWAEVFDQKPDDTLLVLETIGDRIVAAIAGEIEANECHRAILRPPSSLDAWEAHHRGLWHMYRFNRADNEQARHFFELAVGLDPTFARAHAGLSFTHFQNLFQGWAERPGAEIDRAFETAGRSLMADDRDPAAHWAMGRALWLRERHDQSLVELEQAIDLSPNFALGHYTLAFVNSQSGDASAAIVASDHSRQLSPFDPLLPCMLGVRAMALVRLGRFAEAADWGVKAAARPNAHPHVHAIAALSLALADRPDEGGAYLASIHKTVPGYRAANFLNAMKLAPEGRRLFQEGARRLGMA